MFSGTAFKHYIPLIFLAPAVLESNWEKINALFHDGLQYLQTCLFCLFNINTMYIVPWKLNIL